MVKKHLKKKSSFIILDKHFGDIGIFEMLDCLNLNTLYYKIKKKMKLDNLETINYMLLLNIIKTMKILNGR